MCYNITMVVQRNSWGQFVKGNIASPYYGSHVPDDIKIKMSKAHKGKHSSPTTEFKARPVNIVPTREWGYLFGLVLGDGFISETKNRNHRICVESTQMETVDLFWGAASSLGFNPYFTKRNRSRILPNGKEVNDVNYRILFDSKIVYDFLRPYKKPDYVFEIPSLVSKTQDALCGFLQGLFDAEGSVSHGAIRLSSKHLSNLVQIHTCLDLLEIKSYIYAYPMKVPVLIIMDFDSRMRFKSLIGFRLKRKQAKLELMKAPKHHYYSEEDYLKALELRKSGYNFKEIGQQLGIEIRSRTCDVVRGWINRGKLPQKMMMEEKYAKNRQTYLGAR